MIMKKYFFNSFMFAVACVLAFTACSSSSDDDDSPAGSPQANFENNFFAISSAIYQTGAMPNSQHRMMSFLVLRLMIRP